MFVRSLGAITAIGDDLPGTMAGILSELQLFDEIDAVGSDGELVTGGATYVPERRRGIERLSALGLIALTECATGAPPRVPVPVIVCAPEAADLGGTPASLLDGITADARIAVDRKRSRVLLGGRASIGEALELAQGMLQTSPLAGCFLVGVDSLVETERADRLVAEGRILDTRNVSGFIPAEGAAALYLTSTIASENLAAIAGTGRGIDDSEPDTGPPVTGRGLSAAFEAAFTSAELDPARVVAFAHDHSGGPRGAEELTFAAHRPPLDRAAALTVFCPAISTGEIGAAAGALSLALLAFYLAEGVVVGPSLAAFLSDGPQRGAAVVMPTRRRKN
jgi:3-oxoacyl-[acyl-carrier-protein] synthase-1